jgi:hypothetical protein
MYEDIAAADFFEKNEFGAIIQEGNKPKGYFATAPKNQT